MHLPIRRAFEPALLLTGDLAVFVASLWLTLAARYVSWPAQELFLQHLVPFAFLFAFSIAVYFVAGLYDKQLVVLQARLPQTLFKAQLATVLGGALFFFLIPYFGIAPKTNLAIYLILSWALVTLWRLWLFPRLSRARPNRAIVIGEGSEVDELVAELNGNPHSRLRAVMVVSPDALATGEGQTALLSRVREETLTVAVIDMRDERYRTILPFLYNLLFLDFGVQCVDLWEMYERMFDRVPPAALRHGWFMGAFTRRPNTLYLVLKRLFDIVGALFFGLLTLLCIPFVYLAMRLEGDRGPLFIGQSRIGRYNRPMTSYKFRSMRANEQASSVWIGENENRITRTGAFLRRFSIDEFPQVWNILKGELSFIGPRNDIAGLGARLAEAIPYYNTRYIITPGISGWAQINQRYAPGQVSPQSVEDTTVRLAYDLYYLKHRSLMLDATIALKTLRRIFFR